MEERDLLPLEVRARVLALASDCLGGLAPDAVPPSLRSVARFTPTKRARLGATALRQALENDVVFRQRVAELARQRYPDVTSLAEAAAVASLVRGPGWEDVVAQAQPDSLVEGASQLDVVLQLTQQLEAVRATGRDALAAARAEAEASRTELTAVRRKVREMGDRAGRAEAAQRSAEARLAEAVAERDALRASRQGELDALQAQVADAQAALQDGRRAQREGRQDDQLRLRLLLDSLVGAAQGLRRELALPPAESRPADALAAELAAHVSGPALQGRAPDDPGLLDALLRIPMTHLLVDGYNVTKTGYATQSLEVQRTRLLRGLGALAARTSAETTVVFDGADGSVAVAVAAPRGVRLLFSRTGETADEVIRRLVRLEPAGRPVVVVSSDREIIDGVVRAGARAVPSTALVALLGG